MISLPRRTLSFAKQKTPHKSRFHENSFRNCLFCGTYLINAPAVILNVSEGFGRYALKRRDPLVALLLQNDRPFMRWLLFICARFQSLWRTPTDQKRADVCAVLLLANIRGNPLRRLRVSQRRTASVVRKELLLAAGAPRHPTPVRPRHHSTPVQVMDGDFGRRLKLPGIRLVKDDAGSHLIERGGYLHARGWVYSSPTFTTSSPSWSLTYSLPVWILIQMSSQVTIMAKGWFAGIILFFLLHWLHSTATVACPSNLFTRFGKAM